MSYKDEYHPKVKTDLKKLDKAVAKEIYDVHIDKIHASLLTLHVSRDMLNDSCFTIHGYFDDSRLTIDISRFLMIHVLRGVYNF